MADPSSCRPLNRETAAQDAGTDCCDVSTQVDWNAGNCFAWEKPPLRHTDIFRARRKRSNRREVRWLLAINSLTDIGSVYHPEWRRAKIPTSCSSVAVMLIGQMMEPKDRALQDGLRSLLGDFFFLPLFYVCEVEVQECE